jgi:hypothetical protein
LGAINQYNPAPNDSTGVALVNCFRLDPSNDPSQARLFLLEQLVDDAVTKAEAATGHLRRSATQLGPNVGRFTSEVCPGFLQISPPFTTGISSIDGFCLKIAFNALVHHLFPYSHGHFDPYLNVAVRMFLSFPEGLVVGTSSSFALRGTDPLAYILVPATKNVDVSSGCKTPLLVDACNTAHE